MFIFSTASIFAADSTWNDTSTDFNDAGSWTGGLPGTGDAAVFPTDATISSQPNLTASITLQQVRFGADLANPASGYTLSATAPFTLTLTSTGIGTAAGTGAALVGYNTSGTNTVSAPIVLSTGNATQSFLQAAGGTLVVSGSISGGGTSNNLELTSNGNGGIIRLDGDNTYTGNTQIGRGSNVVENAGALGNIRVQIGSDTAFGSGTVTLGQAGDGKTSNATLEAVGGARTLGNTFVLGNNNTTTTIIGSHALTLARFQYGTNAANRTLSVSNSALTTFNDFRFSIAASQSGGITLSGSGAVGIGTITKSNATATATLTINNTGGTTITGDNSANVVNISLSANRTLRVTNANAFTAGTVTLNSGNDTLLDLRNDVGQNFGKNLNWNNPGTLTINTDQAIGGSGANQTHALGDLINTNNTGASTLVVTSGNDYGLTIGKYTTGQSGSGNPAYTIRNNSGGLLTFAEIEARHAGGAATSLSALTFEGTGDIVVTGDILQVDANPSTASGGVRLVKNGNTTLTLNGVSTYSGSTTVNAGVLRLNNAGALPSNTLILGGGVVGLGAGDFTRSLGSGQLQWTTVANGGTGGGFAAFGADRIVNIGGNATPDSYNWNAASFVQTGQALIFGAANADAKLIFENGIGLTTAQRTIRVNNGSASVDAEITGLITSTSTGGALLTTGLGTLSLTNANTYTGGTTIEAGRLLANNTTGSATGTGAVTVAAGATLGGNGTIAGATTVSGIIAPGNSIGTLTIENDVTWNGTAVNAWQFELGPDNTSDRLAITEGGSFLKGSGDDFIFDFMGSTITGAFTLITWEGTTTFADSDFGYINLGGGLGGEFAFVDSSLVFSAIPEPGTYSAIFGVAVLALALYRRRKLRA